eukprot:3039771-Pleurochrysis_carterae.AAC.1
MCARSAPPPLRPRGARQRRSRRIGAKSGRMQKAREQRRRRREPRQTSQVKKTHCARHPAALLSSLARSLLRSPESRGAQATWRARIFYVRVISSCFTSHSPRPSVLIPAHA